MQKLLGTEIALYKCHFVCECVCVADFTTALEHYGTNLRNIKLEYLNGIHRFK